MANLLKRFIGLIAPFAAAPTFTAVNKESGEVLMLVERGKDDPDRVILLSENAQDLYRYIEAMGPAESKDIPSSPMSAFELKGFLEEMKVAGGVTHIRFIDGELFYEDEIDAYLGVVKDVLERGGR